MKPTAGFLQTEIGINQSGGTMRIFWPDAKTALVFFYDESGGAWRVASQITTSSCTNKCKSNTLTAWTSQDT